MQHAQHALHTHLMRPLLRVGVLAHGARLGVVVGGVDVQVVQVLGGVLTQAQVAHRRLGGRRVALHLQQQQQQHIRTVTR